MQVKDGAGGDVDLTNLMHRLGLTGRVGVRQTRAKSSNSPISEAPSGGTRSRVHSLSRVHTLSPSPWRANSRNALARLRARAQHVQIQALSLCASGGGGGGRPDTRTAAAHIARTPAGAQEVA
jgi:hypothetical protein